VVFVAVQVPFASFLVSPAGRHGFFGTIYFDYGTQPNSWVIKGIFLPPEHNFALLMAIAFAAAILTTRIGLGWGTGCGP